MSTAGRVDGLEGALLLDECRIPSQECERLDEKLALALHHLALPPGWSLLGNQLTNSTGEAEWVSNMSFQTACLHRYTNMMADYSFTAHKDTHSTSSLFVCVCVCSIANYQKCLLFSFYFLMD